jgi:hypothetical protein
MNGCSRKSRKSRKSRRSRRAGANPFENLINQASRGLSSGFDSVKSAASEAQSTVTGAAEQTTGKLKEALPPSGGRRRKTLRTRRGGTYKECGSTSGGKRRSRRGGRKTRRR